MPYANLLKIIKYAKFKSCAVYLAQKNAIVLICLLL